MSFAIDILEKRVAAAVALIAALREKTAALERDLEVCHSRSAETPLSAVPPCGPEDLEELARLRAERLVVRERVRGLIRELDRVSW